jgi:plastocyanin
MCITGISLRNTIICLCFAGMAAFPAKAAAPVAHVLMDSGSPYYVPASVTVTAGAAIRWDNPTPTHHTVTHDGCFQEDTRCIFDSGAVDPGSSYTIPSLPPGRYPYQCRIHPIMRGLIIVTDSSSVPSQT